MPHVLASALSGRSKCRGCGEHIRRDSLRFGESLPNLFGEGDMTVWFHPLCAAYKRPHALLEALTADDSDSPERAALESAARASSAHRRVARIDGAERSPSGQATCRHCRQAIERAAWRVRLVFYQEGLFYPGGFIHLACRAPYFETGDIWDALNHFSRGLNEEDRADLRRAYAATA